MRKFVAGFLLALAIQEWGDSGERILIARIQREGTAPTNDIVHWHLLDTGAVCSADVDSKAGKVFGSFNQDGSTKVQIVFTTYGLRKLEGRDK